ncbi:ACP phosphodiesterase [Luteolibacter arcticus]|uniref:ACP phosphodiesterase n=1 Tax=Luteolibacter arcticus TaxID=1581411 RepID=A0ABT3GBU9_9BACT|nr:ACP phosphodiesterase [Luteolibacter arcticus]MCW1921104.1 ACP phosphodiesterase [Luteolibacter arcticus]
MNYLAHFLLAEDDPASRVGNLLGDFVTGRPESLALPLRVVQGIVRHRAIDRFADEHPVTARLKVLVPPERRRFAGVIVDLVHDHFLTRHWDECSPVPFREFIDTCNDSLSSHLAILPADLADTLEERIADDWLGHYGTDDGLDGVFHRVSHRHPRFVPIREAIKDLRRHRGEFENGFREFFPALQRWVRELGPESKVVIDRGNTPA